MKKIAEMFALLLLSLLTMTKAYSNDICPICLLETSGDSNTLGCGHSFHIACVNTALENDVRCPVCRAIDADAFERLYQQWLYKARYPEEFGGAHQLIQQMFLLPQNVVEKIRINAPERRLE